jgi:ketosteroid isomerase-like protein
MLGCSSVVVGIVAGLMLAADPADQAAIRAARTAQNTAIAAGDLDRVASFWTEDVTVRRALGQALEGRAAARRALEPPAAPAVRIVYQRLTKDVEVSAQWPLAFETGTWEGRTGSISGPVVIGGRYSAQWVKRGAQWLIRSEVFVALTCSAVGCESMAVPASAASPEIFVDTARQHAICGEQGIAAASRVLESPRP